MNVIHRISTHLFAPIVVEGLHIIELYDDIQHFLVENFGAEYEHILATPLKNDGEIIWTTEDDNIYKPFSNFEGQNKDIIQNKYSEFANKVFERCTALVKFSPEGYLKTQSLLDAAINIDNVLLFFNGNEIRVVWGAYFNQETEHNQKVIESHNNNFNSDFEESILFQASEPARRFESEKVREDSVFIFKNTETKRSPKKIIIRSNKFLTDSKSGHSAIRKQNLLVWFLFLLLFIIASIFCFYYCSYFGNGANCIEDKTREARLQEILPPKESYRLPIDTTKIRQDENGVPIVTNRLNIALKNKNQNINDFAIAFKKSFPDSTYKIIYIDSQTSRMQVIYPEEKSAMIKDEIKKKLSNFEILIWDESIFSASYLPNDPSFNNIDQSWYFNSIRALQAWDISQGDSSVIVAIIDDGFDLNHPDLANKIVHPYNVITHNDNVFSSSNLVHGTHVAGIALGKNNNNYGSSGIAPKCSFMPIQIADQSNMFTSTDIIDGVLYAIKHKADVINLSLGRLFSPKLHDIDLPNQEKIIASYGHDEELFWKELFDIANRNNVTIVIAAGNQDILTGIDPMQRSTNIIKVSAIDQYKNKANFSNYGNNSTISAPGVDIYNCAPGGGFVFHDGTSMSAPIVTGAVALIKSVKPQLSNSDIIKILVETAQMIPNENIGPVIQIDRALNLALKK